MIQTSIDLLANTYHDKLIEHVNNNNIEYSDAIFSEFVVDGVDPEDGNYEWLYVHDLINN